MGWDCVGRFVSFGVGRCGYFVELALVNVHVVPLRVRLETLDLLAVHVRDCRWESGVLRTTKEQR